MVSLVIAVSLLTRGEAALSPIADRDWQVRLVNRDAIAERLSQELQSYDAALARQDDAAARRHLLRARNGLMAALERGPGDGHRWALLADVERRLFGPTPTVLRYLGLSRRTAPLELETVKLRIQLGFSVWRSLPASVRDATMADVAKYLADPARHHRTVPYLADIARLQGEAERAITRGAIEQWAPKYLRSFDLHVAAKPAPKAH
ncbi:MAG: hypothetical protein AB7U66_03645 [Hyphomicrobiaceae bacterium]